MNMNIKTNRKIPLIVLMTIILIIFTRAITLTHNMELHPDEHVFFNAAQSLKGYISGSSPIYEEVKEYPEGAIVLQLPFHILSSIIYRITGTYIEPQVSGRIAAVFYFTIGFVFASAIIHQFFSDQALSIVVYGLIMLFSVFHIEQSRYGTGDAISYFLIMLLIFSAGKSLTKENKSLLFLLLSTFSAGLVSAVKYPLCFFLLIPIFCAFYVLKYSSKAKKILFPLAMCVVFYFGFAIISPKAALDPAYIIRTSTRELDAYVGQLDTNLLERIWSHFMSVFTYATLYSTFPLTTFFAAIEITKRWKQCNCLSSVDILFSRFIPILTLAFLIYNLFVQLLVMRSLYPFFFVTDIYTAVIIGRWLSSLGKRRTTAIGLCAFLVLRGSVFIALMSEKNTDDRLKRMVLSAVDENWHKTTFLSGFMILPSGYFYYENVEMININDERFDNSSSMELLPGELFINGARDWAIRPFLFNFLPWKQNEERLSNVWVEFKSVNSQYYIDAFYPEYIYYLFGFWIQGTTGTSHEFPTNFIYYRSQ